MSEGFSAWQLLSRTVIYYRRQLFLTSLAVALGAMVIIGAMVIGDSVHYSLEKIGNARLGRAKLAVNTQERWLTLNSIKKLTKSSSHHFIPLIATAGHASSVDKGRSVAISLYGINKEFYKLSPGPEKDRPGPGPGEIIINPTAAANLKVAKGDPLLLRFYKPTGMPGDAPLSLTSSRVLQVRLKVAGILSASDFGDFNPGVSQQLVLNGFLNINWLADKLERPGRCNMVLSDIKEGLLERLKGVLLLTDYGLHLKQLASMVELRSARVFIAKATENAVAGLKISHKKVFCYFVNEIRCGDRSVPYSFVAGLEGEPFLSDLKEDEVSINSWLADELACRPGAKVAMTAFQLGPYGSLTESSHTFSLKKVVPLSGSAMDSALMPLFPGMENAESCSDWDPDIPIDLKRIREQDESYWDKYKGSPKAFITLNKARQCWENRFGALTLIRFTNSTEPLIEKSLLAALHPEQMGLVEKKLVEEKEIGINKAVDFSGLFMGLGFFIILAALLLTALLFGFYIEKRQGEIAVLQIYGFSRSALWRLFALESLLCAIVGSLPGVCFGILYAWSVLTFLGSIWQGAVNTSQIVLHIKCSSIMIGFIASIFACMVSFFITLRNYFKSPKAEVMSGEVEISRINNRQNLFIGIVFITLTVVITILSPKTGSVTQVALFFLAGFFTLVGSTSLINWLLVKMADGSAYLNLTALAFKNSVRKMDRSKAVIRVMACAIFLILAVAVNRRGMLTDPYAKQSGTGGFALYLETALPVVGDLNSEKGRHELKLDNLSPDVRFVQLPSKDGSDASCLNLNRVSRPSISGVKPSALKGHFSFKKKLTAADDGWQLLNYDFKDPLIIPAIADMDVIMWNLGKNLGEDIVYEASNGKKYRLRFVAGLSNSIFQGRVLVSLQNFYRICPESVGSKILLVDTPAKIAGKTTQLLALWLQSTTKFPSSCGFQQGAEYLPLNIPGPGWYWYAPRLWWAFCVNSPEPSGT
ncbi:FtsX-like permease family protein [Candidatus Riflebacteria bacterium]